MSAGNCRYYFNPFWEERLSASGEAFTKDLLTDVSRFHESLPEYSPTPLVQLEALASKLGLGSILIKDESYRFGLNSFKVLGACYAIHRVYDSGRRGHRTLSAATEGNHGLAVAWMARRMGLEAVIYVPGHASPARLEAIRREGASIVTVEGSYEDTVLCMARESAEKQYQIISDIGFKGYTEIPLLVTAGYLTLFSELEKQIETQGLPWPDYMFLQAGVGTFASSGIAYFRNLSSRVQPPTIATVEPMAADCLLSSASSAEGHMQHSSGKLETKMSGLNCGFPSIVAWPIVRSGASLLIAVRDETAAEAADLLLGPTPPDPIVRSSESGAAGFAGLLACCQEPDAALRDLLGLGTDTTVLLVNTEGPLAGLEPQVEPTLA